jgi:hypothetical protein
MSGAGTTSGGESRHAEAKRLHALGFKLCGLKPMRKEPVGNDWQVSPVMEIQDSDGGYGMLLAANNLCSVDPDNVEPAREGLLRCGFDLDDLMSAGVGTTSTRPGSGGRSTFKSEEKLRWITFRTKAHGTILELRAASSNLQDCLPGTVYMGLDEAGQFTKGPYSQGYANGKTMDMAPDLPPDLLAWWLRMSEDIEYRREQELLFGGPNALLSVSGGDGKLAFPSDMRRDFNNHHEVPDILERHGYTTLDQERWAPLKATGAPCVRLIKGKLDLWQSDHASCPLHGMFDAWVAHVVLDHGGDLAAAEEAYEDEYREHTKEVFTDNREETTAQQRSEQEQARREYQKRENQRVGEGVYQVPVPEILTLSAALKRFVFLSDGSRVADIMNPHYDLAYQDWAATFAASKVKVKQPPKRMSDGTMREQPDITMPMSALWKESKHRKTGVCRTFKADGGLMLPDPNRRLALNTWRPFDRSVVVEDDLVGSRLMIFLDHITFLFPNADDRERFLDWLAHIEQRPGVLVHRAWLHIAQNFGLGRNWLATILTKVWAGSVAPNLDLPQLLKNGFNGQLSRKVLAVVDEIREGGRDTQWEHAEKLKSTINEEFRLINPKYGRQTVEFNACGWLMFSNHLSAIPMELGDRRFEVVVLDAKARSPEYYARLYAAKDDPQFIAEVAAYLGQRDISKFKPGAHAKETEAKLAVTQANLSHTAKWCQLLIAHWPVDVISSGDLYKVLEDSDLGTLNASHRRVLEQFKVVAYGDPVKLSDPEKRIVRVSILRNPHRWKTAEPREIRAELLRGDGLLPGFTPPRDYLLSAAADAAESKK